MLAICTCNCLSDLTIKIRNEGKSSSNFLAKCKEIKGNHLWISGNPSVGVGCFACWKFIFNILKYRDYREFTLINKVSCRHCYHLPLALVLIDRREDTSPYDRSRFGEKGKIFFQIQNAFFDDSMSEYTYILKHFCHECMVSLLNFVGNDLNRISLDSYVCKKKLNN